MTENPSTTLTGTVEKIIKSLIASEAERAQIIVDGADYLYRELRIENALTDAAGNRVQLKPGAKVQVTVQAASNSPEFSGAVLEAAESSRAEQH